MRLAGKSEPETGCNGAMRQAGLVAALTRVFYFRIMVFPIMVRADLLKSIEIDVSGAMA
jgi:hypothetical protein